MNIRWFKKKRVWLPTLLFSLIALIPERWQIPVKDASPADWHFDTFWYDPWGSSGTHKGIDIFSQKGTEVLAANDGLLLYQGELSKGGKVLVYLGSGWKIHYYAHLDRFELSSHWWVKSGDTIGYVGDSGNAAGKAPHLHFSIVSLIPMPWRIDGARQGWKKMFYLDPTKYILRHKN